MGKVAAPSACLRIENFSQYPVVLSALRASSSTNCLAIESSPSAFISVCFRTYPNNSGHVGHLPALLVPAPLQTTTREKPSVRCRANLRNDAWSGLNRFIFGVCVFQLI